MMNIANRMDLEGPPLMHVELAEIKEATKLMKGKQKVLDDYAFNADGILSQDAVKLLDSGSLNHISKCFKKQVIDMEEQVFKGVYVKDILHNAVLGTLEDLLIKATKLSLME